MKPPLKYIAATPPSHAPGYPLITINKGMAGWFAVMLWWNPDGFPESFNTAAGRHDNQEAAVADAKAWAEAEGLEYRP